MIDDQAAYVKVLSDDIGSELKVLSDDIGSLLKVWGGDKDEDILTFRDQAYMSMNTKEKSTKHPIPWLKQFDVTLEGWLKEADV